MRIIVSLELHVGDDLPVVRGQFIIGCLGMRAICDVIVKDREILHLAKPFCVVGVEMPRHQDLVDRFLDATKGRGENHIAQGFAHKEFLWEMQAHAVDLFLDYFVFGVGVAVAFMRRVVAAHRCVILERCLASDDLGTDRIFAVVEIAQHQDGVACFEFFEDFRT